MPQHMFGDMGEEEDLAPSSHRLATRLGVLAEELQLRKASFFGEEEDDYMPKWKGLIIFIYMKRVWYKHCIIKIQWNLS